MFNRALHPATSGLVAALFIAACASETDSPPPGSDKPADASAQAAPAAPSPPAPPAASSTLQPERSAPPASEPAGSADLCRIDIVSSGQGVIIKPIVRPTTDLAGSYSLTVTKRAAGSSADTAQEGPFTAPAGQAVALGVSEVSLEPGASLTAKLEIRSDGRVLCRKEVRR